MLLHKMAPKLVIFLNFFLNFKFIFKQLPYKEVVGVSVDVVKGCIAIDVDGPCTSDDGNVIVTTVL